MFKNYVLVRKSTLCVLGVAAAGAACLIGYHFYKHHRATMQNQFEEWAEEANELMHKGEHKAKEVVDDAKDAAGKAKTALKEEKDK